MIVLDVAAIALAGLIALHGLWWTVLALAALPRPRPAPPSPRSWRFAVIVPAHNEERLIARCLASLRATQWRPAPEIVVVADNCSDSTAALARRFDVTVLGRHDRTKVGKSYALQHALAELESRPRPPDAVVVVDADSVVAPRFYEGLATALDGGTAAAQAYYEAEPAVAPTARLRRLAFALTHWARPLGSYRLGLGSGIKGNGFAVRWECARDAIGADGLAEDAAATLVLARRSQVVAFAPDATLAAPMAASAAEARRQEGRWEQGRLSLSLRALTIAAGQLRRGRFGTAAAALEVATLPLSLLGFGAVIALGLALVGVGSLPLALVALSSLISFVLVGLAAARIPLDELVALASLPGFLLNKLRLYLGLAADRGPTGWARTRR